MVDKIMALLAIALLVGFLAILGTWVQSVDLLVVIGLTIVLVLIDFWLSLRKRN